MSYCKDLLSYCISIDAIDLKYLPITNYTQRKNAKLFDILSSAKRHDYVEFKIFASKANNETAAIPPHCTTICQICNIIIPSCYITEHNQSIIHKMYSTIAENALERLKKYLNVNNYVSDAKKLLYSYFCDVCCLALLESEKEIHENSQNHCKALKKVKQLQDFLHLYSVGLFAADNEEELCDNSNDKSTASNAADEDTDNEEELCDNSNDTSTASNAADEDTGIFKGDTVFKFCDLEVKQDKIEIESFVEPKPETLDNIRAVKSEDAKVVTEIDPKVEREVTEDKAVFKPEIKTNKDLNQTESEVMPEQASIQLREGTIEIELSDGTIVNVSEYQYNGVIMFLEDNITICLLCDELVKNSLSHKETSEKHLRIMKIPIENTNCIRQIADKFNHCILCNEIFTDIKAHLDSNELHLSRKASAVEGQHNESNSNMKNLFDIENCTYKTVSTLEKYMPNFYHLEVHENFSICKVCKLTIMNSLDLARKHVGSNYHADKFKELLKSNKLTENDDSTFRCDHCHVDVAKGTELLHINSEVHNTFFKIDNGNYKMKQDSTFNNPASSVLSQTSPADFVLPNNDNELNEVIDVQISQSQACFSRLFMLKENGWITETQNKKVSLCQICEASITNNRIYEHVNDKEHITNWSSYLKNNELKIKSDRFYCEACRTSVDMSSLREHCQNLFHNANIYCNKKNKYNKKKLKQDYCCMCGVHVPNNKRSLARHKNGSLHRKNLLNKNIL